MKFAVLIVSIFALATAKLDYGPCPSGIQQAPWKASMTGTYYLQYYDSIFDYLLPLFKIAFKIPGYDCMTGKVTLPENLYDRDALPLKKKV